ncbi:MAG TPA: urea transporter [Burkholderiales bacterium]|nr:urea transporter [Burkholderiales bacterium]
MRTPPPIDAPAAGNLFALWRIGRMCLTGAGQIMLQKNAATGAVFIAGIAWNSLASALGAVLGLGVATFTALWLRYGPLKTENGIYGFNGALVGIAAFQFLVPGISAVLLATVGAAASTVAMRWMMRRFLLPAFTAPFVLMTWLLLGGGWVLGAMRSGSAIAGSDLHFAVCVLQGIGQVMFQGSVVSGAVFLAGIACCSWRAAARAVAGSVIGCAVAVVAQLPAAQISAGLFGYNSALVALALRAWWPAALGAALTVPIAVALQKLGIAPLTAPFVLATWAIAAAWRRAARAERQVK